MKQMRVLHVFGSLNMGGAETLIMNIYRNIDREKVQFDFIVHGKKMGVYEEEIKKLGGKVYHMRKYKAYNHICYVHEWKTFFKNHKDYRIIHGHMRSTASIYLKIAKKYGLITICHSHSTSNGKGIKAIIKKKLQLSIKKSTDYFFSCSEESAKWLYGDEVLNFKNNYIINNCIETNKFIYNKNVREKIRKELKIENKYVIGQVGRLVDVKNHLFTLNVFKEYLKIGEEAVLLFIGSGKLEQLINNKIKEYGLEKNVILLKDRKDVNVLMQAMDVLIMPSKYEGLPLTLVEAQAASLPCIISKNVKDGFIINQLITCLSLESSINEWIENIDKQKNNIRKNREKEIVEAGFDAYDNSKWFEKFYVSLLD